MKRIIAIVLTVCVLLIGIPCFTYATSITPEVSFEEFEADYGEMQKDYDGELIGEIVFEKDSEFYHLNGELMPLCAENGDKLSFEVNEDGVELPKLILDDNSSETESTSNESGRVVDEEYAESIGYEINASDDKTILTQPLQTHRLIVKSKYDINPLDSVEIVEGYNGLHIVQFDNLESTKAALEYYEKQRNIDYVEPDSVVTTLEYDEEESSANTDLNTGIVYANHLSWGSESIGVDDYIDYLGDVSKLPEIIVGIIDTGVELEHEFLKDRILKTHFNASDSGDPNSENDDKGHGTHVAGIIVDNTTENVKIKGYKVLNERGSATLETVCLGIDKAVSDNVNVINMSLGGVGGSQTMVSSVSKAIDRGITVCVSAGNSSLNVEYITPAGISSCITVAAINEYDETPYWTNWGDGVDVVAPGVAIYSSFLGNSYRSLSGTSMACPFATAASALVLSKNPNMNCYEVCDFLVNNGRIWYDEKEAEYSASLYGKPAIYIGYLSKSELERTKRPVFNYEEGRYPNEIALKMTCEDANSEIYYTLDGSRADNESGILYTGPVIIDKVTRVHAVAYSEGKIKSLQTIANYYIMSIDPEGNFEIANNGIITAYNGENTYLILPDKINGITVTGIGNSVFADSKVKDTLTMIRLPETVTYIGEHCFHSCEKLISVEGGDIIEVGKHGFAACQNLKDIDLSKIEIAGEYAFSQNKAITELRNENLEIIERCAFNQMDNLIYVDLPNVHTVKTLGLSHLFNVETISLPNVQNLGREAIAFCWSVKKLDLPMLQTISTGAFNWMYGLEEINLPSLSGNVPTDAFRYTYSLKKIKISAVTSISAYAFTDSGIETVMFPNLETIEPKAFFDCNNLKAFFAPSLLIGDNLPYEDEITIYLSNIFEGGTINSKHATIIAPKGSAAHDWAKNSGYDFIASDSMVKCDCKTSVKNKTKICCTCNWEDIDKLKWYADNISCYLEINGEIISIEESAYNDGRISFDYEFTPPNAFTNNNIQAFVDVDGMVFKSELQNKRLLPNSEPDNDCIHNWEVIQFENIYKDSIIVLHCANCESDYYVSFSEHINKNYPPLDVVEDGIINAKDYAYLLKNYSE